MKVRTAHAAIPELHRLSGGRILTVKTMKDKLIIGLDIGGTRTRIGAVSRKNGEAVLFSPCEICNSEMLKNEDPAGVLCEWFTEYLRKYGISGEQVETVSIGIPGSVRNDFATVFQAPNTAEGRFDGVHLSELLSQRIGLPVLLNKDVNNLLYHDLTVCGSGASGVVVAVYIGTGIGSAAAIDGKILYGSRGFAMDAGHISLYGVDKLCGCGRRGCAEALASGHVLREIAKERFHAEVPDVFAQNADDPVLMKFTDDLAEVPAILATVFDPDLMIIGGGVCSMRGFPRARLENRILERAERAVASGGLRFFYAKSAPEDGVLGAAIFADRYRKQGDKHAGFNLL